MKFKVRYLIVVMLLVLCIGIYSYNFHNNSLNRETKIIENQIKEKEKTSLPLALMVETDIDSENYQKWNSDDWPGVGYVFNKEKSKCANGNTINYDERTKQIIMNGINADRCYVYFDKIPTIYTYDYTGDSQEFVTPVTGEYQIELWGAQGGDIGTYLGGRGAYTKGTIYLAQGETIYVYVGGAGGNTDVGGYNGGGDLNPDQSFWGGTSGGGATDVRLIGGFWNNFASLKSRIMVSAGGGGSNNRNNRSLEFEYFGAGDGGAGGALNGLDGEVDISKTQREDGYVWGYLIGLGGTQNSGGGYTIVGYNDGFNIKKDLATWGFPNGGFGYGLPLQSGSGGGYYSGGSGEHAGAGGGSSFISGHDGCLAIEESSTENNIIHKNDSIHYSGKVFTNSEMIAGNNEMPNPNGGNETGHSGNGYAKITLID